MSDQFKARSLILSYLVFILISGCGSYRRTEQPVPRDNPEWVRLHTLYKHQAELGSVNVLFFGDSITQGWGQSEAWQAHFEPRKAAHFGIGGDGTEHLLFRVKDGEIGNLRPETVILLIGTNNLARRDSPADVASGVNRNIESILHLLPGCKLILLGLLPRGKTIEKRVGSQSADPRVSETNSMLKELADRLKVHFLDCGPLFLDDEGRIPSSLMPDFLHLSEAGYERLAIALEPLIKSSR